MIEKCDLERKNTFLFLFYFIYVYIYIQNCNHRFQVQAFGMYLLRYLAECPIESQVSIDEAIRVCQSSLRTHDRDPFLLDSASAALETLGGLDEATRGYLRAAVAKLPQGEERDAITARIAPKKGSELDF
jgi:hypothetical protein